MDYTHLYKERLSLSGKWGYKWDVFISAFNPSERVRFAYENSDSDEKYWIIHREYELGNKGPGERSITSPRENEAEFINDVMGEILAGRDARTINICIDITGFMRPHLIFLVKFLFAKGIERFDVIYSEPSYYRGLEKAQFSGRAVTAVRQVSGYEGVINNDTSNDVLIIGAGYESHLMAEVAEDKERASRVLLLGLPSLSADMYQQSALRTCDAADALGDVVVQRHFAPANDPFVTATVLSHAVSKLETRRPITNLYLSPLATKAQALGFALFYMTERSRSTTSILFPFISRYSIDSAKGISRTWRFVVEQSRSPSGP